MEHLPTTISKRTCNPIGRMFYSASTLICTPASKSQEVGLALGRRRERPEFAKLSEGWFHPVSPSSETPFNLVFEARQFSGHWL